jgi:putative radical SAM enzyme (TIGR03279 family)
VVRIAQIEAGSVAEELRLEIGSRIVRVNGQPVRDGIDFTYLLADSDLEMEVVTPEGEKVVFEITREHGEPLGIVPAPDPVRECANKCVFCFIDGNPANARESLWLKDDDFRLSFTYGSYVTLTNLGPKGLQRLIEQRISPLYVSVHATEPEVRERLLVNDRAGLIMDQLRDLAEGGLEVHSQVVLCPGWNDGEHLDRTLQDLYSLGEGILTLSVVPVGLTKYNVNRPVRLLTPEEAATAIRQVERARVRALAEREAGWAYAADELFLQAGAEVPDEEYYDDWSLAENGVGMIRSFLRDFEAGLSKLPDLSRSRIHLVTGRSMAPLFRELAPRLERTVGVPVYVREALNGFYGETVTVAGLLAGRDILRALRPGMDEPPYTEEDLVLLPAEALNAEDLFIDSISLQDVRDTLDPARVLSGHEITATLGTL